MVHPTRRRRAGTPAEPIADGVHRIKFGFVSAYLIEGDDGLALVDCGEHRHGGQIVESVQSLGRVAGEIQHILVTHHHPDHTGSLAELARTTEAPVYVHPADVPFVEGDQTWSGFNRDSGVGRLLGPLLMRFQPGRPTPTPVDHHLADGERLPIAGGVTVLHTPGHTPGHTSFLLPRDGGVLLAGDAAINVGGVRSTGHWLAITTHDHEAADASFERLATLEFEIAAFGHGKPIRTGAAAQLRRAAAR